MSSSASSNNNNGGNGGHLIKRPMVFVQPTAMSVSIGNSAFTTPSASSNLLLSTPSNRVVMTTASTSSSASANASGKRRRLHNLGDSPPTLSDNDDDDNDGENVANTVVIGDNGDQVAEVIVDTGNGDDEEDDVLADVLGVGRSSLSRRILPSNEGVADSSSVTVGKNGPLVTVRLARPSASSPATTLVVSPTSTTTISGGVVLSGNQPCDDEVIVDADDDCDVEEDRDDDDALVGQLLSATSNSASSTSSPMCSVCGTQRRVNLHYGVLACESCRNFFKRALANQQSPESATSPARLVCLRGGNQCEVTPNSRSDCKACRLRKCLAVGMSRESCKLGRRPLAQGEPTISGGSDDSLNRARALSDLQLQEALQQARAEDKVLHRRVVLKASPNRHQQPSISIVSPAVSATPSTAIEIIRELPQTPLRSTPAPNEEFQQLKSSLIDQCQSIAGVGRSRDSISQLVRQLSPAVLKSVGQRDSVGRAQFCAQLIRVSGNLTGNSVRQIPSQQQQQQQQATLLASEGVVREEVVRNESDTDSDVEQIQTAATLSGNNINQHQQQHNQKQLPSATVIKLMQQQQQQQQEAPQPPPQQASITPAMSANRSQTRVQLTRQCHSMADDDFKILPVQREYCRDLLSQMIQQLEDPVLDSVLRRRQAREKLCRELVKISLEIMASGRTARNLVPFGYAPTSIVEQLQLYFKIVFGPDMLQEIVQSSQDLKNTPPQMDSTENFRDYLWNLYVFRMNFILSKVCDFAIKFGEFQSLSTADRCQIVLNCFKAAAILIHSQFWVVSPACYLLVQDRSLSLADMKAHFLYGDEFVRLSFEFTKDLVELRLKEEEFVIFLTLVIFFFDTGNSLSPPDLSGRGILTSMRRQLFSKLERVVGQQRRYLRVLQLWRSLKKLVTEEDRCIGDSAGNIVDKCLQHYTSGADGASNSIRLYPDLFLTKQSHLVQIWLASKK